MPVIVFSCCFSPDMFNPTTQSSLDVFFLLQRVPRERSEEGSCIWLWKMIWCHLQRKYNISQGSAAGWLWKYCLFVTRDCLEDCFSLICLKPISHCFHYKDFNVPVSFGKGLNLFWNKSKDPQMYCLLSGPAHESCASGSHCRGVRRIFILWVVNQVSQWVCMGPAPWQQRTARTWNVGTFGQHSCPAVQGHESSLAQGQQGSCTGCAVLHWGSTGLG